MAEASLENVPRKAREFYEKGNAALDRGTYDFAMDMYMAALDIEPAFFKARVALRAAMIKNQQGKGKKFFSMGGIGGIAKASSLINKKPHEALKEAEKVLRTDPTNIKFIKLVDQAAMACELPEVAAVTYEAAKSYHSKSPDFFRRLGMIYLETNESGKAKEAFEQLVKLKPGDQKALKLLKDASAIDTMQSGGWEGATSFREVMKDEKEAILLEQEGKSQRSAQGLDDLIQETKRKIETDPQNINYKRALADLYTRDHNFEEAIAILEEANEMSGGADPEIDRAITGTRVKHFEAYIQQLREAGDQAEIEAAEQELHEFLFHDAQARVTKYPNDLAYKFELGVLLYQRGEYTEAIQQLQQAQRNPQKRIKALFHIALCFKQKGQLDIALEQMENAVAELVIMDDTKKDILYELGQIAEQMKDVAKARTFYRQIYTVDIGYKDVAEKMEKGMGS